LKNPDSSVSQSSFLPRILSTLPAAPFDSFRASDNSLLSRPSLPVDDIETKGRVLFPAQSVTTLLSPVNSVENDEESGDDESLPISTVIPAILAAMQDKTTSPDQKTSLQSLLTDMVRSARQQVEPAVPGGVDFSQARRTPDGRLCVIKEETIETLAKEPVLECVHKNIEKCHFTYITQFDPTQEEECNENFQKNCQITFRQEAVTNTIQKCYRPQRKVCNGQGPEQCQTVFESDCTTKYVEKSAGKFVGDTACQKVPVEICGRGCQYEDGEEECHQKQIDSLVDVPEEICDLNPQKTCHLVTKLVPSLKPREECTTVPKEICNLKFTNPSVEKKPLRTEWCLEAEDEPNSIQSFGRNSNNAATDFEFQSSTIRSVPNPPVLSNYQSGVRDELRRL